MFVFADTSHEAGSGPDGAAMFRCGVPPHIGQSCDASGATASTTARTTRTGRTGREDCTGRMVMVSRALIRSAYLPAPIATMREAVRMKMTPPEIAGLARQASPIEFFASTSNVEPAFRT